MALIARRLWLVPHAPETKTWLDDSRRIDQAFSLSQIVSRSVGLKLLRDEATIRALLGRWVSELEPAVAYNRQGDVIGLTIAGAHLGTSPFILWVPHRGLE